MDQACYPPYKQYGQPPVKPNGAYANGAYVKYVPVGYADNHSIALGYLFWLIGFTGAHRFYYGKPLTGILWFFTFGLLGIGWLVDAFLIPSMDQEADARFIPGQVDYNLSWVFLVFLGWFGIHRFYQGKIITGIVYLLTGALFGVGYVYDVLTMNGQISEMNRNRQAALFNVV